jgi:hypothetical protein
LCADVFNPIAAGTIVGASLAVRRGPMGIFWGAFGGFVVLCILEGLMVYVQYASVCSFSYCRWPFAQWL